MTQAPYRVLARKYRPQAFADLVGQEALVRTLSNAFRTHRVAHAFLLTGIRGIGKTTTARIIARALNCIGPDGTGEMTTEPCGVCPNCRMIAEDRHVDVLEMDAASHTGVADIRDLIETVHYAPTNARYKVYIIDEVHMLSSSAFNALLKTLEEPPPHVIFIFATTELRKIPVTILSRCQRFDLKRLSTESLADHLTNICTREAISAQAEALRLIAIAAEGSVRDGLSLLDRAIAHAAMDSHAPAVTAEAVRGMLGLADRTRLFDLLEAVMKGEVASALEQVQRHYADGAEMAMLLQDMLGLTHTLTRLQVAPAGDLGPSFSQHERQRAAEIAKDLSVPVLSRAWQMLMKGIDEVKRAPDALAAAEMVLIRLCHASQLPLPGDLIRQWKQGAPAAGAATGSAPTHPGPGAGPAPRAGISHGGQAAVAMPQAAIDPRPSHLSLAASNPEPKLECFADIVAFVEQRKEAILAHHLAGSVEEIACEPGRIELHLLPSAPADLCSRLARLLDQAGSRRWSVIARVERGKPTLISLKQEERQAAMAEAALHPLAKAVLEAFPGSRMLGLRTIDQEEES